MSIVTLKGQNSEQRGYALILTLMLIVLLMGLLAAYSSISNLEMATTKYSKANSSGFFAAEAGLNIRAEAIRSVFVGFNRPTGTSPAATAPCTGSNNGTGEFICRNYTFNNRNVVTYVEEDASNPVILTIPPGERYQYLNAQEYRYTVTSLSKKSTATEADLGLRFKTRLVPLFQFAAFYNKDLEILPGPTMTLSGPVHTNGNLYLYSSLATLTISGQVTAAGDIYRGRKDGSITPSCNNQQVYVYAPAAARSLIPSCSSRRLVSANDVTAWNGMIQQNVQPLTVPGPEIFDPNTGSIYLDRADLRLALVLNSSGSVVGVQVKNVDGSNNTSASTTLNACSGVVSSRAVGTTTIWNFREDASIRLLDVDLLGTLNCLRSSNWFGTGKLISDTTDGGLVFHLTVSGPNSTARPNTYGVRIRNAQRVYSSQSGAPAVRGLTVVSDQAAYIMGDFNSTNKIPVAVMSDSLNILSNAWNDANSSAAISSRVASSTTINAAFLAGTDVTGGNEGASGHGGVYNGGLENFPRLHENWSGRNLIYRGSFVSLGTPRRVDGAWGAQSYDPPNRDWNYDTSFNNAANLPPITPRFVYLRQELFVRDFDG